MSTSGHSLADGSVASTLISALIPLATIVTPNIPETSALLGGTSIQSVEGMEEAARKLQQLTGCGAVLVKGGHLEPLSPSALTGSGELNGSLDDNAVDVLFDGVAMHRLSLRR